MAKLYNITDWNEQLWWSTGGTRDKKIYLNPEDGELYYFKKSFKKGQRDFKHEFWSEIIASEIGENLGFDILEYSIALRDESVGCISKSMIKQASEELIEGGKYLQAFDNTFNPENTKLRNRYNFELITNSLVAFRKGNHVQELIETIVFDALIGNSDRHQENWAIINVHSSITENVTQIEKEIENGTIESMPNWTKIIIKALYTVSGKIRPEIKKAKLLLPKQTRFAPIYDSGCSFGRELDDERIKNLLTNEKEIHRYISKGLSEIHWGSEKITHFELIENLLKSEDYKQFVLVPLERISRIFDSKKISKIIIDIDHNLISTGNTNFLPKERKEFILKLLTLRFEKLKDIYTQYT